MKTVLFITLVAMMEVLVSGFVMPNEAVPLGTWRRSEKIEWEVADLDIEEDADYLNIQNYIEKNSDLIVVKDKYIYTDGGESQNTHGSFRPMIRYQQEVTFYTNNNKVEQQQSDSIRNLLIFFIVIKLIFLAFFVLRYLKNKLERDSIQQNQISEEPIQSIEYRIRSHQYQIDHLRRYFLQHQEPVHRFTGYHQPQQYYSSKNSIQQQIQNTQQILQKPLQILQNSYNIQIFSGEYQSHYVFRTKPTELFEKIKQVLNKLQILWIVLNKYILQTDTGLKISLQRFEGIQSAFIIVFSQKTQLNNLILTELNL